MQRCMLFATGLTAAVAALSCALSAKLVESALFLIAAGIFAVAAAIMAHKSDPININIEYREKEGK